MHTQYIQQHVHISMQVSHEIQTSNEVSKQIIAAWNNAHNYINKMQYSEAFVGG